MKSTAFAKRILPLALVCSLSVGCVMYVRNTLPSPTVGREEASPPNVCGRITEISPAEIIIQPNEDPRSEQKVYSVRVIPNLKTYWFSEAGEEVFFDDFRVGQRVCAWYEQDDPIFMFRYQPKLAALMLSADPAGEGEIETLPAAPR